MANFAQNSNEQVMQAVFGFTWAREFAQESFDQGKRGFDRFLRVTRRVAEDGQNQATTIREQSTAVTQKTLSNTMEFGQKLARVKQPLEFTQCQIEYLARQAQAVADGTKELVHQMQQAAESFASNASSVMAEARRHEEEVGSRTEQSVRRQRERADALG